MNAKATMVTLVANGVTREFEFSHAEALLKMPHNGGWKLPKDSQFEFTESNGLQSRGNKKENRGK